MAKSARMEKIEAMLTEDPDDSFLRYSLGMEYVSIGDDATAVEKFQELIALKPNDPDTVPAYHMAGQALGRLGREDEAVQVLGLGIDVARLTGNHHALGEMEALRNMLG